MLPTPTGKPEVFAGVNFHCAWHAVLLHQLILLAYASVLPDCCGFSYHAFVNADFRTGSTASFMADEICRKAA